MNITAEYCRRYDRFAAANAIELIEIGPGLDGADGDKRAASQQHRHGPRRRAVHSAATTFFAACNAAGQMAVGTNMSITCLKPVAAGVLTAEATEIARSRKLAHGSARITDEAGELVAVFQGTAYVKGQPFPPAAS